jgi:hypothetical protein
MRKYTEIKHYTKKQGGGSFYRWLDVEVKGNGIEVSNLHASASSKSHPKNGSGSLNTYSLVETKALIILLKKAIKKVIDDNKKNIK